VSPDGDAIGSMLGIYHLLRALGKESVICVSEDPVPRMYQWLAGADRVEVADGSPRAVDVAILVDAARTDRLGKAAAAIPAGAKMVVLDHHLEEEPEGDVWVIDPAYAAVGEIVVELFGVAGVPVSREAAECVYVSLITDTGGFRFANTTPRSHRIAAQLLETGIDVAEISSRVFEVMAAAKFELLRRSLRRMKRCLDGRVAYTTITLKDMKEACACGEDLDGLVNYARNIEGVDIGILLREVDAETTKVSFRSRNSFNCARFLGQFGGGGHAAAAGATLHMPLKAAQRLILARVRQSVDARA